MQGSRDGAVVRTLSSHQCCPGSIPGLDVICGLSLLLVLVLTPRGFSLGSPGFPSPQKPTIPNSNSLRNLRATGLSVVTDCYVSPSLNKVGLLFYAKTLSNAFYSSVSIHTNPSIPISMSCVTVATTGLHLWIKFMTYMSQNVTNHLPIVCLYRTPTLDQFSI